jgi:hypothetical protein
VGFFSQLIAPFRPRRMPSLIETRAPETPKEQEMEDAAAADVKRLEEDDGPARSDAPGNDPDEL